MALTKVKPGGIHADLSSAISGSANASAISGSHTSGFEYSGTISGSATSTGSFGDVALRKGGKVKFSDASYIALSGSSISAPGEGIDMVANNLLALNIDDTGAVTKPLQPCFNVYKSGNQNNIGEATTVLWQSERFDLGSNFGGNLFTAPVTGKYYFSVHLFVENLVTGISESGCRLILSNFAYEGYIFDTAVFDADAGVWNYSFSTVADMDSGDVAYVRWRTSGDETVDIANRSYFSGFLVC